MRAGNEKGLARSRLADSRVNGGRLDMVRSGGGTHPEISDIYAIAMHFSVFTALSQHTGLLAR